MTAPLSSDDARDIQLNLRFRAGDDIRPQLKAVAKAEDRSVQSLLRAFVIEGLRARLRDDRITARV
jgi:hypothetical protein